MADVIISDLPEIITSTNDDYFIINDGNATTAIISQANLFGSITDLQTVRFADGTALQPSISFTSDPNVGIYKPSPDSWAVSTNGIQRLVIDSAGKVGVNQNSPSSWYNGSNNLVVGDTSLGDNGITIVAAATDVANICFADGTGVSDSRSGMIRYDHTDDHMRFDTASFERMRITEDGDMGLGTSAPTSLGTNITTLEIQGNTSTRSGGIRLSSSDDSQKAAFYVYDGAGIVGTETAHPLGLYTGNIERVTIDTSGNITVTGGATFGGTVSTVVSSNNYYYEMSNGSTVLGGLYRGVAGTELYLTNNSGSTTVGLFGSDGSATFNGIVTADRPVSGTPANTWSCFNGANNGTITSSIKADGSATFSGTVDVTSGSYSFIGRRSSDSTAVFAVDHTGLVNIGPISGSDSNIVLSGSDGTASFNSVKVNGNINLTGAGTPGPKLSTPAANTIAVSPDGSVERIRVDSSGAIGLSGANYGLDGQVLTSQGPGVAPAWVSIEESGVPDISGLNYLP